MPSPFLELDSLEGAPRASRTLEIGLATLARAVDLGLGSSQAGQIAMVSMSPTPKGPSKAGACTIL
jgi:hypothetical protein